MIQPILSTILLHTADNVTNDARETAHHEHKTRIEYGMPIQYKDVSRPRYPTTNKHKARKKECQPINHKNSQSIAPRLRQSWTMVGHVQEHQLVRPKYPRAMLFTSSHSVVSKHTPPLIVPNILAPSRYYNRWYGEYATRQGSTGRN